MKCGDCGATLQSGLTMECGACAKLTWDCSCKGLPKRRVWCDECGDRGLVDTTTDGWRSATV